MPFGVPTNPSYMISVISKSLIFVGVMFFKNKTPLNVTRYTVVKLERIRKHLPVPSLLVQLTIFGETYIPLHWIYPNQGWLEVCYLSLGLCI